MGIYWIISLSLTFVAIVEIMLSKNENTAQIRTWLYFVAVVVLFTFGGIRGLGTGLDDFQYRDFYAQFIDKIIIEGFWRAVVEFRYEPAIYAIAGATASLPLIRTFSSLSSRSSLSVSTRTTSVS